MKIKKIKEVIKKIWVFLVMIKNSVFKWLRKRWESMGNNYNQLNIVISIITLIIIIGGFYVSLDQLRLNNQELKEQIKQLNISSQELEEQVRQNDPHLASTSMCPILEPDSVNNYTAKLHNFGNSPAYYDIGYESENVSLRISNFEEHFLYRTELIIPTGFDCTINLLEKDVSNNYSIHYLQSYAFNPYENGLPKMTKWKTIPPQGEHKINFQFKTYSEPSLSLVVIVLDYKLEPTGKLEFNEKLGWDVQTMQALIPGDMGVSRSYQIPEVEIEEMKPVLKGSFRLLDCEYRYDEFSDLYLTDFQLIARDQGLLDEYQEQIILESQ